MGTSGADTFDSKGFATYAQGYGGADTFIYNSGYGALEINEYAGFGAGTTAVLQIGGSLTASNFVATFDGLGDVALIDGVAGDQIKLDGEVSLGYGGVMSSGVTAIKFADGTSITQAQLSLEAVTGSATNTRLIGTGNAETIDPKGFASYIQGNGGADTFIYNAGYGALEINGYAGWGANTTAVLQVGGSLTAANFLATFDGLGNVTLTDGVAGDQIKLDGEVSLYGGGMSGGVMEIKFADGTSITQAQLSQEAVTGSATNTRLIGTGAAETIDPKGFAPYVQGNGGADTFIYNAGYGALEINGYAGWGANTTAVLQVGGSLTAANFLATFDGLGNVTLTDGVAGDQIKLDGEVSLYGGGMSGGVMEIKFADGTSITQAQLSQEAVTGSATNTRLIGTGAAETIDPKGFAPYVQGNGGADTFIYNAGYGALEINGYAGWGANTTAVLQVGGSLTAANFVATFDGLGDVTLTDGVAGDQIKLDGEVSLYGGGMSGGVMAIKFTDGTSITQAQLSQEAVTGSATNTRLIGTGAAETIDPKGFAPYVQGNGGADTFIYNAGYGALEIKEYAGFGASTTAVLQVGGSLTAANFVASADGLGDVTLTDGVTGDHIELDGELSLGYGGAMSSGVTTIKFADGTSITEAQLSVDVVTGSAGNTRLIGTTSAETIDSKGFASYAQGNGGADTFVYKAGYGALEINEDSGAGAVTTAVLQFGSGVTQANFAVSQDSTGNILLTDATTGDSIKLDLMIGSAEYGVGSVTFADGTSLTRAQLVALAQANAILGSPTNTSLVGTSGADTFDSKGFATSEQGNGGADTFIYSAGYGALEVNEDAGFGISSEAVLNLNASISRSDVVVSNSMSGGIVLMDAVSGDKITIDNEYSTGYSGATEYGVKAVVFSDGTTLDRQQLINLAATGSATNTRLYGSGGADMFDSRGFATYAQGYGGTDTFIYNSGYGALEINEYAGFGANTTAVLHVGGSLTAANFVATFDGLGDVTLADGVAGDQIKLDGEVSLGYGGAMSSGVTAIKFADGTSITQAQLSQEAVTGSATNTRLIGTGNAETIDPKGFAAYVQGNGGADTFIYNSGYGALEINEYAGFGANTTAVLHVGGSLTAANFVATFDGLGDVTLTDGVVGDQIKLDGEISLGYGGVMSSGVTTIKFADGTSITQAQLSQEAVTGSATNTRLIGTGNAETIDSKGFATYVQGNGGADTFIYNSGYGALEINEYAGFGANTTAVLHVGGSLTAANFVATLDGLGDVTLTDGVVGDQIKLDGEISLGYGGVMSSGVTTIKFADGTSITEAQLSVDVVTGSAGNTRLIGTTSAETIDSKGFASYAQGNGGADTFVYKAGYGALEINEDSGAGAVTTAVLQFGSGVTQANFAVSQDSTGNILLTDATTGDSIKLDLMIGSAEYGVGSVTFADGTSLTRAQLVALAQANAILGSPTNTSLVGTSGADTFDSKGFATSEQGNGGADTFIYSAGYGALEVNEDAGFGISSEAVLNLNASISRSDVVVSNSMSGGIVLMDAVSGDKITIDNEYSTGYSGATEYGVKAVVFSDGTTLDRQQLINLAATGSATNTRLYGSGGADMFDSRGFATYAQGYGGTDTFIYNSGYGALEINEYAGFGANTTAVLHVGGSLTAANFVATFDGLGDVTLADGVAGDQIKLDGEVSLGYGGAMSSGVTAIKFADGTSITQAQLSQEAVTGSATNTRLIGTGNAETIDPKGFAAYVQGNGGADTFIYNSGYGALEINEYAGFGANTTAVLHVGGSLTAANFVATFDGLGDVTLTDGVVGDQIKLDGEISLGYGGVMSSGVTTIKFADGTSITQAQLSQEAVTGSATNTRLIGTGNAETIDSKGFATYVQGNGGADTFIYNSGYGALEINEYAGFGANTTAVLHVGGSLTAANFVATLDGLGDVTLTDGVVGDQIKLDGEISLGYGGVMSSGVTTIKFADGTSITQAQLSQEAVTGSATNTRLIGTGNAETIDSKGFATYVQGNGGADTFIYNAGYGALEINEYAGFGASTTAVLQVGGSLTAANFVASADSSGDVTLTDGVAGDQIKLDGEVWPAYGGAMSSGVTTIKFADGTSITQAQLSVDVVTGSAGNTRLFGTTSIETIDSKGFSSYAQGNGGADTFVYKTGYGALEINDFGPYDGAPHGTVELGGQIAPTRVWMERDGNDLKIEVIGSSGVIDLEDWYAGASWQPSQIVASDGAVLGAADVGALVQAMAQFSATNSAFNPVTAPQMPTDQGLQSAIAAAWRH